MRDAFDVTGKKRSFQSAAAAVRRLVPEHSREHTGSHTDQSGKQRHLFSDQVTVPDQTLCGTVLANILYVGLSCPSGWHSYLARPLTSGYPW